MVKNSNARSTGCRERRDFCGSFAKNRDAYGSPSACDCYILFIIYHTLPVQHLEL